MNNDNFLFKIKDLVCSYGALGNDILHISDLQIQTGKLVFLLGASGSGKSTLLETLGLMNNTIKEGKVLFYPEINNEIDYRELWKKDKNSLSETRKKYFSFIFQNTNLMDNFTAYENVMVASMIKDGDSENNILNKTKQMMEAVNLPETEVSLNTLSVNLSGGQRQRLAFVRAITPTSTVLFCDEPTGNLDELNANELFEVIKLRVKEGLTAVVVSHDINLAIKHADWIFVLTKGDQNGYGEILPENIFSRSAWEKLNITDLQVFVARIKHLFKPDLVNSLHAVREDFKTKSHFADSFRSLFYKKEFIALLGKRWLNAGILFLIMLFTFLAIGFANGSLNYIDLKMKDPFVEWLNISIPAEVNGTSEINNLTTTLDIDSLKKRYEYKSISFYKDYHFRVLDNTDKSSFYVKARTLDFANDSIFLRDDILSSENKIAGVDPPFADEKDVGLIVTSKILKDFKYSDSTNYLKIVLSSGDSTVTFPIPIKEIVKNLPGNNDIAFLKYFDEILENYSFLSTRKAGNLIFYIHSNSAMANEASSKITNYVNNKLGSPFGANVLYLKPNRETFGQGFNLEIDFDISKISSEKLDALYNDIIENCGLDNSMRSKIMRIYDYSSIIPNSKEFDVDYMSVYFDKLDRVRNFDTMLLKVNNEISPDMSSITQMENINFLSHITYLIAFILILFGVITICLFISNLLKMHLNKVKVNIGTFKAIGLGNNESRNIYFGIIISFILFTLIVSVAASLIVGIFIDHLLRSNLDIQKDNSYFILLNDWITWLAMLIILLASISVSFITIKRMLSKSPGDLIYNR